MISTVDDNDAGSESPASGSWESRECPARQEAPSFWSRPSLLLDASSFVLRSSSSPRTLTTPLLYFLNMDVFRFFGDLARKIGLRLDEPGLLANPGHVHAVPCILLFECATRLSMLPSYPRVFTRRHVVMSIWYRRASLILLSCQVRYLFQQGLLSTLVSISWRSDNLDGHYCSTGSAHMCKSGILKNGRTLYSMI